MSDDNANQENIYTLTFTLDVYPEDIQYPIRAYLEGDISSSEAARRLGWTRTEWERHLIRLFELAQQNVATDHTLALVTKGDPHIETPGKRDYELKIIPYRGGKALLIDSFDIMQINPTTHKDRLNLRKHIDLMKKEVDYILLLTSMKPRAIRPMFRDLFNRQDITPCYRYITEKGQKMVLNRIKDLNPLIEELEKGEEEEG